ncbi:hypothetical protein OXPF_33950 [Oxobacter pfennigii]|uniref:Uncharacterized protein n=1 Tax=Oxobacter pfennigii TaxID=36849 RepID=A0A0P8W617_9CLOT|nr:LDCC motif putative metal-binding protein [Oxobacter pfennigii]KPU43145.1 hypothetical protein OXPF_33950 [Oxobacter pfennigii]
MKTLLGSIKKRYNEFIERLAKENEKSFGNGRLDCCQLNKNTKTNVKNK